MTIKRKALQIITLLVFLGSVLMSYGQDTPGVTNVGSMDQKLNPTYINENGKLVCWPRVSRHGQLLKYGPVVTTDSAVDVTSSDATLYGNILHNGWCGEITEQGFLYSTDEDFTSDVHTVTLSPTPGFTPCATPPSCSCSDNSYHTDLTGLTPGTKYYYVAYAKNSCGTTYGDTLEFTTENGFTIFIKDNDGEDDDAVEYCYGGSAVKTYTALISTTVPSPVYKWSVGGVEQSGATTNSYTHTFAVTASTNVEIKCEVTSGAITKSGTYTVTVTVNSLPNVVIDGSDAVCSGAEVNLTASGANSYEWSWTGGSAMTASITHVPSVPTTYYVTGTDSHGCEKTAYKTVTINHPMISGTPAITGDNIVCASNTGITLTASGVTAAGGTLKYRWLKNGSPISGATGATYSTGTISENATYTCQFYALQDGCSSDTMAVNHSVVIPTPVTGTLALSVVGGNTLCKGSSTTINAAVTGNDGDVTYAWTPGGQTGSSYSVTNIAGTTTYTCTATVTKDGCTATTSKSVTITVPTPTSGVITIIPEDAYVCYNGSTELTASAAGASGNLSYQWYKGTVSESNKLAGETYQKLVTENLTTNQLYSCVVTATAAGTTCVSDPVTASRTVSVYNPTLASVSISGPTTVCPGGTATLEAAPNGAAGYDSYSYQWYQGTTLLTGKTSSSYTTEALNANTTYYCQVKALKGSDPVCESAMKEGAISIGIANSTLESATITATAANLCKGGSTTLSVSAGAHNGSLSYQWGTASGPISGATSSTYTTPNLTNSTTYYCTVTNTTSAGCAVSKIPTELVTVISPSVGTLSLEGGTICYESTKTLELQHTGSNGTLSYQWSTGGSDISGATSDTYTTPALTANTAYTVNVTATVSSPITCTATDSRTVTVTVSVPVYDTLLLCGCQLSSYTFPHGLSFTNAEMDEHVPPRDTLMKEYQIGDCPDAGHLTVVLWHPGDVLHTSCSNIHIPVNSSTTQEVVSGSELHSVTYYDYKYDVVQIGNQCWLKENLRVTKTPDGQDITPVTANTDQARHYYSFDGTQKFETKCGPVTVNFEQYTDRYGLMYNWFSAMNNTNPGYNETNYRGICPEGWHIPDMNEWQTMYASVEGVDESTLSWSGPSGSSQVPTGNHAVRLVTGCEWINSTVSGAPGDYDAADRNSSGFSARPSGCWNNAGTPGWYMLGEWAFFWSSTRYTETSAYNYDLHPNWAGLSRDNNANDQSIGRSVRCVRDEEDDLIYTSEVVPADNSATCSYTTFVPGTSGVCWNTTGNPTTEDAKTTATTAAGSFSANLTGLSAHTLYYVRSYVIVDDVPIYGNELTFRVHSEPVVVTADSSAGQTTATLRGNLTDAGGYNNTERGIYWGTTNNPTTAVAATGTGEGVYSVDIDGLTGGTTYYYRAYATNEKGTVLGDVKSFTTPNCVGNVNYYGVDYPIKLIGSQCWMTQNLRTTKTRSGDAITKGRVANALATSEFSSSALYYNPYEDLQHTTEYTIYGYLYNHTAAELICPEGWHLPTEADWQTLDAYAIANYGCNGYSAQALASSGNWRNYSVTGGSCAPGYADNSHNNATGFTLRPAGYVDKSVYLFTEVKQVQANVWSSTPDGDNYKYVRIHYNFTDLWFGSGGRQNGYSVRCIHD